VGQSCCCCRRVSSCVVVEDDGESPTMLRYRAATVLPDDSAEGNGDRDGDAVLEVAGTKRIGS
jgi:hypothetical protein